MEEYEDGREVPCWKMIKEVEESGVVRQEKQGKMMLHSEGAFVQERVSEVTSQRKRNIIYCLEATIKRGVIQPSYSAILLPSTRGP
jgi:aspartate oxidase